jgi:MFS transporter, DHA2 family, multidrug resistance protein
METTAGTGSAVRAGRREWLGLAVLALPTLLLSIDLSVLYLALPRLSADLGADSIQQLWITDVYGFVIASFLVTMGTLGDRIGRRRLLLVGGVAFAAASTLAAFSVSPEMLIVSRALMGLAGATLMPSTLALISTMFQDPKQQGTAISVWMSCFMGGMLLGPVLGGLLLDALWWGAVFLLAVPVMLVLLALGPVLLPEYRNPEAGRLDPASVVLSLAALFPLIYGLKEIAKYGLAVVPVLSLLAGVAFAVVFARRQNRLADPLLDMSLFKPRVLRVALLITILAGVMSGSFFLVTMYFQSVGGLTPFQTALWMLPQAVASIAAVLAAPALAQRIRPGTVLAGGLVLVVAGYLTVAAAATAQNLVLLAVGLVVSSVGAAPLGALGITLVFSTAPMEKMGSASSMTETTAEFGIALGVALMGTIGTAVYRGQVDPAAVPGLPADAAAAVGDSVTDALTVAATLPAELAGAVTEAATTAFSGALAATTVVSAAIAAVLAVVAFRTLRHLPPTGQAAEEQAGDGEQAPEGAVPVAAVPGD